MLGDSIKKLREEKNIELKDLAKAANVSVAYISLIENNKRQNPNMKILKSIAKYLNVSLDDLLEHSSKTDNVETVAAHAINDLTEEEQNKVIEYVKFLKSQRG